MTQYELTPKMMVIVEDVFMAVSSAEETNLVILPVEMKEAIVESLTNLKVELADQLLMEFDEKEFEFEVGDGTFSLLREAVATQYGGEMTDEY